MHGKKSFVKQFIDRCQVTKEELPKKNVILYGYWLLVIDMF